MRAYIEQMELKFTKEKDQFINKIIKLKDRIEVLEDDKHYVRPRSLSEQSRSKTKLSKAIIYHTNNRNDDMLEIVSEISEEGTNRTIDNTSTHHISPNYGKASLQITNSFNLAVTN